MPAVDSLVADESPISELMNVAWASHEIIDEYLDEVWTASHPMPSAPLHTLIENGCAISMCVLLLHFQTFDWLEARGKERPNGRNGRPVPERTAGAKKSKRRATATMSAREQDAL